MSTDTLKDLVASLGFSCDDFSKEIEITGNLRSWRDDVLARYLGEFVGSYAGISDIEISGGVKYFLFTCNRQNGSGPMSYWWEVRTLVEGAWKLVAKYNGSQSSMDRYSTKFRSIREEGGWHKHPDGARACSPTCPCVK